MIIHVNVIIVVGFDPFDPNQSCLNKFELTNKDYKYPLEDIKNIKSIELVYFSLTNENSSEENNSKYWQAYFNGLELPIQAPYYIKEAKDIIDYHNLTDQERDVMDTMSKREAIR